MATAMLNVRLDKNLKTEGDRVLAQQNLSATQAVRGLYRYMEEMRNVPDFCRRECDAVTPEMRREKMRNLVGVAKMQPGEDLRSLKKERLSRLEF